VSWASDGDGSLIQQALLQVLQPCLIQPSARQLRVRRGRSAIRRSRGSGVCAVGPARGCRRGPGEVLRPVNHDILIDRLRKRVADAGAIRLVRAYLTAASWMAGVDGTQRREPQGGPLSRCWPTSCWMRWTRNWNEGATASCVYATMRCVCSQPPRGQAGDGSAAETLWRLRLKVNEARRGGQRVSAQVPGYSFWVAAAAKIKRRVAAKAMATFKARVRK